MQKSQLLLISAKKIHIVTSDEENVYMNKNIARFIRTFICRCDVLRTYADAEEHFKFHFSLDFSCCCLSAHSFALSVSFNYRLTLINIKESS